MLFLFFALYHEERLAVLLGSALMFLDTIFQLCVGNVKACGWGPSLIMPHVATRQESSARKGDLGDSIP